MAKIEKNLIRERGLAYEEKRIYLDRVGEYKKDLEEIGGVFLSAAQIARYLGVDRKTASKFLADVPRVTVQKREKFRALEVARKMARVTATEGECYGAR